MARGVEPSASVVIAVAAAVLRDAAGRILLAQRPPGKHLAGAWEFPGGKCEPGEDAHQALVRELAEELGVTVTASSPLLSLTHDYPDRRIRLLLRDVAAFEGDPRGLEGQAVRWVTLDEMAALPMPSADRPIVRALGLDPRYAITEDLPADGDPQILVDAFQARLDAGFRLLQLRVPSASSERLETVARACAARARKANARWLLNGDPELALSLGADGVHLSAARLLSLNARPLPSEFLVAASCHDAAQLAQAGRINADFVCLSPVRATATHPQAPALGWAAWASLCARSPLPVMALGGVGPDDLAAARAAGAFGVAGMRAFSPR